MLNRKLSEYPIPVRLLLLAGCVLLGGLLEFLELGHATGNPQVSCTFGPVAGFMSKSVIVFFVRPLVGNWNNMVDLQLTVVKNEVYWLVANEAST